MKCSNCSKDIGIDDEFEMPEIFFCPHCGAQLGIAKKPNGLYGVITIDDNDDD